MKKQKIRIPYLTLANFLKARFGAKLHKIPLHTYKGCPHKSKGGCTFCSSHSYSDILSARKSLKEQLAEGIKLRRDKGYQGNFIAYLQTETPTVANCDEILQWFDDISCFKNDIKGVSIASRPDTLSPDHLKIFSEISGEISLWLEIGLQSIHDNTLKKINRGHSYQDFLSTIRLLEKNPEIMTVAHLIMGLPGENFSMMLETIKTVNTLPLHGLKLHHLQVVKNTKLAEQYDRGEIQLYSDKEYLNLLIKIIPYIRKDLVIHRLVGDVTNEQLIAPLWQTSKPALLSKLQNYLRKNKIFQGMNL